MKGIIIYEDYRGKKVVEAIKLGMVNYDECKSDTSDGSWINNLSGVRKESTQAYCNEEDTYDFETGALIALMKMCGREKVIKACDELYKDDNYKNALQEMTENNEKLMEEIKRLNNVSEGFYKFNCRLIDENETLKKEKEQIIVARNILYNKLKEENEKLREKNEYKYLESFSVVRRNGKQYESLVKLFKKLDQKKVDAAYKEAYGDRVIWCTSQPSIRDTMDSLIEESRAFTRKCVDEWLYGPPTKREEMWKKIFKLHKGKDVIIVVKKEDVNSFLHEIENKIPEITWASDVKIFEGKGTIKDIYDGLKRCDTIYFRISKETKLSYSIDPYIYPYYEFEHIPYLPPMRWDLFKKGRIVVGVKNNYELEEFRKEVERNTGIKDIPMYPTNFCLFYSFDKDNYKIILETIEQPNIAKINGHKVYYWEDVR